MISPAAAAPATAQAELMRKTRIARTAARARTAVGTSTTAVRASCQVTTVINASEPALTPSSTAAATGDLRIFGTREPLRATKTNAGRKMPVVASEAPG